MLLRCHGANNTDVCYDSLGAYLLFYLCAGTGRIIQKRVGGGGGGGGIGNLGRVYKKKNLELDKREDKVGREKKGPTLHLGLIWRVFAKIG